MLFYLYILCSLPFTPARGVVTARRYFAWLERPGKLSRRRYLQRCKLESYNYARFGPRRDRAYAEEPGPCPHPSMLSLLVGALVGHRIRRVFDFRVFAAFFYPVRWILIAVFVAMMVGGVYMHDDVVRTANMAGWPTKVERAVRYGTQDPSEIRAIEKRRNSDEMTFEDGIRELASLPLPLFLP